MMLNFLREYLKIGSEREFLLAVGQCLSPFMKPGIGAGEVLSGSGMAEFLDAEGSVGWGRVPAVIKEMIKASGYAAVQPVSPQQRAVWFAAETAGGLFAVRFWPMLRAGYAVSGYGTAYSAAHYDALRGKTEELGKGDPKAASLAAELRDMEVGEQFGTAEAAEILGIRNGWLHNCYKNGLLEHTTLSDKRKSPCRVSRLFLDEFLQKRQWELLEKAQPTKIYRDSPVNIFGRPKRANRFGRPKE